MIDHPKTLRQLQHRDDIGEFLNEHDMTGEAAEIGTYLGEFAQTILCTWTGRRLTLIDPYRHFPAGEYVDGSTRDSRGNPIDFDAIYQAARSRMSVYPNAHFIRATSFEATPLIKDWELQFLYIDGNHAFQNVTQDIHLWWPKLVTGGVMGLHDFYTRDDGQLRCGVFDAVMDFAEAINQRPHVTHCTSAWFVKL